MRHWSSIQSTPLHHRPTTTTTITYLSGWPVIGVPSHPYSFSSSLCTVNETKLNESDSIYFYCRSVIQNEKKILHFYYSSNSVSQSRSSCSSSVAGREVKMTKFLAELSRTESHCLQFPFTWQKINKKRHLWTFMSIILNLVVVLWDGRMDEWMDIWNSWTSHQLDGRVTNCSNDHRHPPQACRPVHLIQVVVLLAQWCAFLIDSLRVLRGHNLEDLRPRWWLIFAS